MQRRTSSLVGTTVLAMSLLVSLPAWAQQKQRPSKPDQPKPQTGEVLRSADGKLTITIEQNQQVTADTKITLNGQPATLEDLQPGDRVTIRMRDQNVAVAINATRTQSPRQSTDQQAVLGVTLAPSSGAGVLITEVEPGSPAARAGFRSGDYILSIDTKTVSSPNELTSLLRQMQPGREVQLVRWRRGEEQRVAATLAAQRVTAFRGGFGVEVLQERILDGQRRLAQQNQRLENLVQELRGEIRQLRDELGGRKGQPARPTKQPATKKQEKKNAN